jgi:hypothetical protein
LKQGWWRLYNSDKMGALLDQCGVENKNGSPGVYANEMSPGVCVCVYQGQEQNGSPGVCARDQKTRPLRLGCVFTITYLMVRRLAEVTT